MVLDDHALDVLFRQGRTVWNFTAEPVTDDDLKAVFELMVLGPTSANCLPARLVFVRSEEGKAKLRPALSAGNVDRVMAAPVTVIVAQDPLFYQHLPKLCPDMDVKAWFSGNPDLAEETAFRNSTLQGAYFMLAARAAGLDCGPMSGFDRAKVDRAFFTQNGWKSNFLINVGHGVREGLPPRPPRLGFEEVASFA